MFLQLVLVICDCGNTRGIFEVRLVVTPSVPCSMTIQNALSWELPIID